MRKIYLLLLAVFSAVFANAQIGVTVTGNTNTTPNLSVSYASLSAALTALNGVTAMSGPVTFTLDAGASETAPATGLTIGSATLNPVLSATNTVTIVKAAGGATTLNAGVGTATPGSAAPDGILKLTGADYITIDGLTFTDGNGANPATMEYGVGLFKLSATDGSNNNTIKNCIFNMQRVNNASGTAPMVDGAVGILIINSTATAATTAITVTAASGSNSNNKIFTNTINGGNIGIAIIGYAAATPFTLADQGNDVGGSSAPTGNQILNYGGGATTNPAAAIRTLAQYGLNIGYNTIDNNNGSGVNHGTTLRGIYTNTATSANETITNNNITVRSGATTSQLAAIENVAGSTAASNTISITNNTISTQYSTATSGVTYGIYNNGATPANLTITGNTIGISTAATSGSLYPIFNAGAVVTNVTISSNNINGISCTAAATSLTFRGIYESTATATCAHTISNNTFQSISFSGTASGEFDFIYAGTTALSYTMNANTTTGSLTIPTTGTMYMIYNSTGTVTTNITNNNLTGAGISKTGAGGTVYGYYNFGSPGSGTATLSGNTVSNVTLTGATAFYGLYQATSTSQVEKLQNNTISNITGGTSTIIGLHHNYGAAGSENSGNVVSNMTAAATVTGIQFGNATASLGMSVFNNNVNNLTTTGASVVTGIIHTTGNATNMYKNKIYGIQANNAGATASGLTIAGGLIVNVYNNLIGNITGPVASANLAVYGINITSTTATSNINVYYNTVYLNASSSGANFGSAGISHTTSATATTAALDLRNNIIVNTSVASGTGLTIAYRRSSTTLTNFASSSNNNLYYAGTPGAANLIFSDGTNNIQTLGSYKTLAGISPRDQLSVTENPPFLSTTGSAPNFLHLSAVIATQAESGGSPIATYTDDYDGDSRNATTPDMGADELAGIPLDLSGPAINYTALTSVCASSDRTLTGVSIIDISGVPTAGALRPRIYYKKNNGSYFSQPGTLSSGTATNGLWDFNIIVADMGGLVAGDKVSYYVIAQDVAATPNISSNPGGVVAVDVNNITTHPASPNLYYFGVSSGTFTVGVGGNFTTLTDAVGSYNAGCITGPIVFNLTDATYPSETFPITINAVAGASAVNTLTIKPAAGATPTISGSVASGAIIRVLGNYITINGSNSGGTTRDMTLANTSTTAPSVLVFGSTGTTPITNNTLRNCTVINGAQTATAVILSDGATPGTAGYFNNITVQNNNIQRAYIGVYAITAVVAGNGSGTLITQNDLNTSGANSLRLVGVYVQGLDGATISNNNIGNYANTLDASNITGIWFATGTVNSTISGNTISGISGTASGPRGIAISNATAASNVNISGNTITSLSCSTTGIVPGIYVFSTSGGITIQNNKIRDIKNTSTTSTASYGINLASTGANFAVINNFISDIASYGSATSTSNGMGIALTAAGTLYTIYYNSVWINSDQTFATGIPSAINITSSVTGAGTVNIRNNIFSNTATVGTDRYAIYCGAANTIFAASGMDYNNYYSSGSNLGFIGSNRSNLAAIQAGFGQNVNSTAIQPNFMTPVDLHLNPGFNNTLNNTGTPIGGITTDIDGDTRVAPTDVGADEFTPCSPAATATASSNSPVCEGSTLNLTGTSNGDAFSWIGPNGFSSTLQNPSIPNVTLPAAGVYTFQAFLAGCPSLASNTTVVVNPRPTISSISATPTVVCYNGSSQLNVNASGTLGYVVNPVTFAPIGSGAGTVILASAGTATTALTSGTLDDGYWNGIALPFSFTYYGTSYSTINVQTNGIASFSAFTTTTGYSSSPQMPNSAVPNNILGVFGDMEWRFGGVISCYTSGSAPNRIFVINYDGSTGGGFYNGGVLPTALVNYQIQLFENGNKIQFHTVSITADASTLHTQGIENSGGTAATVVTGRNNSLWSLTNDGTEIALSPVTYAWLPVTFLNDPTIANPLASSMTATTNYTVTVSQANGCSNTASVNVTVDQPLAFTVTGGGSYCAGGTGVLVGLSGSESGVNYQLYVNASPTGSPVAGTGSAISFGLQTTAGTYTVVATKTSTGCTNNMTGSVTVTINPLPTAFTVTGGGSYCTGGSGVLVGLSGSESGVNYQLYLNASPTGAPVAGTGSPISFGLQTAVGTYTVVATNATTTCTNNMTGSVTISIDPLPTTFTVTGGGSYCTGGSGVLVGLSGSQSGVNYQLYVNAAPTGAPVAGTGAAISFGLQTAAGTYTVVATNATTTCTNNMTGSVTVTINPLPTVNGVVTEPTTCVSADGAIDVTVSGTPGPYTYFWSTVGGSGIVQGVEDQSGLTIGQYTVLVTDQTTGCQQTAVFNLVGPGGCAICPTIGNLASVPPMQICGSGTVTLNASGLVNMGITYGITFKYSNTPLADPYVGGTLITTVPNGSLGGGGTTATTSTSFGTSGTYYIYAILSPVPIDPSCRPSALTVFVVNAVPTLSLGASPVVCAGTTSALLPYTATNVPASLQLISNGGFETGSLGAWTLSGTNSGLGCDQGYAVYTGNYDPCGFSSLTCGGAGLNFTPPTGTYGVSAAFDGAGPLGRELRQVMALPSVMTSANLQFSDEWYVNLQDFCSGCTGIRMLDVNILNASGTAVLANLYNVTLNPGANYCQAWTPHNLNVLAALAPYAGQNVILSYKITIPETFTGPGWFALDNVSMTVNTTTTYSIVWSAPALGQGFVNVTNAPLPASPISLTVPAAAAPATYNGTITITNGFGCTSTPPQAFTVTVNPVPTVNAVANQTYCAGAAVPSVVFSSPVAGAVFNWSRTVPVPDIGLAPTSGTGNVPAFTATNTSNAPIVSTFTVTPTYTFGGVTCTGPSITFTITINPVPSVNAVANQSYCNGSAVPSIVFSGPVAGTVFNWSRTVPVPDIGLAPTSGTGNVPAFTASNTSNNSTTSTFSVVATYTNNGVTCTSAPIQFTITINPTPVVNPVPNQVVCNGAPTTPVIFSSPVAGTQYTWTNNTPSIGLAASGTGNIPSFIAINPGPGPVTATITVTPSTTGSSASQTFNYTGAVQTWVVPAGVTSINIQAFGAQGNANAAGVARGGLGGMASGTLAVTPGETLFIYVGGGGAVGTTGGFNGGGNGGTTGTCLTAPGGGGGGASDLRQGGNTLANRKIVAAGGGGTAGNRVAGCARGAGGGGGGGFYGGGGGAGYPGTAGIVPSGGTQVAGGTGGITGTTFGATNGQPGVLGIGGNGGNEIASNQAGSLAVAFDGGAGGGLTGNSGQQSGANNFTGQSGAGGSSYTGGVTSGVTLANQRSGNGQVLISYTSPAPPVTCTGSSISFTITVNPPPTIVCPANITVNNTPGLCGAIVNYPPAVATGPPPPVITYNFPPGSFFPVGTTTVIATATNTCGTATCSFTITVIDNQAPTIVCPANITRNNDPGVCGANVTYPFPTVSDNCSLPGGTAVSMNQSSNTTTITPIQIGCQYAGGITAENSWWRAYDMSVYALPAGVSIKSVRFGIEKITGTTVPITARLYRQTSGTFPTGTRTLIASQTANFAPQVGTFQTITFTTPATAATTDIIIVELYCPDQLGTGAGFFIGSNASPETGPSYLSAAACGAPNPTDLATLGFPDDNIHLSLNAEYYTSAPTLVQIAGLPSGALFPVGTTTNTFRATDAAGNQSTCSFTVTVVDAQAPAITCPANIVRNTDAGVCTATIAVPNPTFSDNCAVTQLTWAMTGATTGSSPATGINFVGTQTFNLSGTTGQGITTITYTIRDAAGNINTCSFTVTVRDALIPVISLQPATKFVCVGSNAVFSVTAAAAGGPLAYQWQAWDGTAWVNIAGATSSTLTINSVTFADNTKSYRCVLTGLCSVVISGVATLYVNPLPSVTLLPSIPPVLSPTQSLTINSIVNPPGGSYAWFFNGTLSASHTGSSWAGITVDGIGTYRLVYTDPNGCTSASADLVVSGQPSGNLWIYPNPNTGRFTVRFFNQPNETVTINVYDMRGARIHQQVAVTGTPYTGIDVDLGSVLPSAVYLVEVRNSSGKLMGARRIVVRHP